MTPCHRCRRHARPRERRCTFCGALLVLVATAVSGGCDRPAAAMYGGPPPAPTPSASAAPTVTTSASAKAAAAGGAEAVRRHLEAADPSHAGKLEVHQEDVPKLALAGVELWHAEVVIPDGWTEACWVSAAGVGCAREEGAFERLLASQGLAKDPSRLTDAEWIELVRFATTAGIVVSSATDAKKLLSQLPADAKVTAPAVARAGGGLTVRFFYVQVANDSGPIALVERELGVRDGAARVTDTERYRNP
jgi:hypothetical protein